MNQTGSTSAPTPGYSESRFDPELIRAAEQLLRVSCIMNVADKVEQDQGWLDLYSHEPFADCRDVLREVVVAITPFVCRFNSNWEFRLFCRDGYLCCYSDGSKTDDNGAPIRGSDAFSE